MATDADNDLFFKWAVDPRAHNLEQCFNYFHAAVRGNEKDWWGKFSDELTALSNHKELLRRAQNMFNIARSLHKMKHGKTSPQLRNLTAPRMVEMIENTLILDSRFRHAFRGPKARYQMEQNGWGPFPATDNARLRGDDFQLTHEVQTLSLLNTMRGDLHLEPFKIEKHNVDDDIFIEKAGDNLRLLYGRIHIETPDDFKRILLADEATDEETNSESENPVAGLSLSELLQLCANHVDTVLKEYLTKNQEHRLWHARLGAIAETYHVMGTDNPYWAAGRSETGLYHLAFGRALMLTEYMLEVIDTSSNPNRQEGASTFSAKDNRRPHRFGRIKNRYAGGLFRKFILNLQSLDRRVPQLGSSSFWKSTIETYGEDAPSDDIVRLELDLLGVQATAEEAGLIAASKSGRRPREYELFKPKSTEFVKKHRSALDRRHQQILESMGNVDQSVKAATEEAAKAVSNALREHLKVDEE